MRHIPLLSILLSFSETTLAAWNLLLGSAENAQIDLTSLSNFVQEHFDQPGGELEDHQPIDFNAEVVFSFAFLLLSMITFTSRVSISLQEQFVEINDPYFRAWAQELHRKWPTLCRRVSDKVLSDPNRYVGFRFLFY
jgi:hypothetical protein